MVVALESLKGATVVSKTVRINQSQNLTVNHDVPIDDPTALAIGTEVIFTDTELGLQFTGKIINIRERFSDGEGIAYECADTYRTLVKTPAVLTGDNAVETAAIKFVEGTLVKDALNAILAELPTGTLFPGGVDLTGIPNDALPLIDKTGQSVDTWIDDLLNATDGGVATIDHTAIGGPKLVFFDFYTQPDLDLLIGNFDVVTPVVDDTPVLKTGEAGHSLNNKFESIAVEGCGEFTRRVDVALNAQLLEFNPVTKIFRYKFVFPQKKVTGRFIDVDGNCRDLILAKLRFGFDQTATDLNLRFDYPNIPIDIDDTGQMFAFVDIKIGGVFGGGGPPPIVLDGRFTYTSYDGPFLRRKVSIDAALDNEGEKYEHHKEFFKYDGTAALGAVVVDQSAQLDAIADALFKRFSEDRDLTGGAGIHVKGLDPDVQLGSKITNGEFQDARIQGITFQYVNRTMQLELSTVPIRDTIARIKQIIKDQTREGGSEFAPSIENTNCFCGGKVFTDEDGNASAPRGGGADEGGQDGGGGTSFDCVQGQCQQRNDGLGHYDTQDDCARSGCEGAGADWRECVGCVESGVLDGEFLGLAECETAHAADDPFANCHYECDTDNGCQPVLPQGTYATLAACETACSGGAGSGSGDPGSFDITSGTFGNAPTRENVDLACVGCSVSPSTVTLNVVKVITVDPYGHMRGIECTICSFPILSGLTSSFSVCCGDCTTARVLVFTNGALTGVGDCA